MRESIGRKKNHCLRANDDRSCRSYRKSTKRLTWERNGVTIHTLFLIVIRIFIEFCYCCVSEAMVKSRIRVNLHISTITNLAKIENTRMRLSCSNHSCLFGRQSSFAHSICSYGSMLLSVSNGDNIVFRMTCSLISNTCHC